MAKFGSNLNRARDVSRTVAQRAFNLRSCAMNLAHIAGMTRSAVMAQLRRESGVDLEAVETSDEIERAIEWMVAFRAAQPEHPM